MSMGTGLPPFRGRMLKYAADRGLHTICDKLTELSKLYGERFEPAALLIEQANKQQLFYEGESK